MNPQAEQVKATALEAIKEEYRDANIYYCSDKKAIAKQVIADLKVCMLMKLDNLPAPEPSEFMRWLKDHMDGGDGRTNTEDDYCTLHKFGVYKLWKRIKQELEAEGGSDG